MNALSAHAPLAGSQSAARRRFYDLPEAAGVARDIPAVNSASRFKRGQRSDWVRPVRQTADSLLGGTRSPVSPHRAPTASLV